MRFADLAVSQQLAVHPRHARLAVVAAHMLDARVEGHIAPEQCIHRQRATHDRGGIDLLQLEEPGERECRRHLRAVQQREPLLGSEGDGCEALLRERLGSRQHLAVTAHAAESEHGE